MLRLALVALSALVLAVVAGCGGADSNGGGSGGPKPPGGAEDYVGFVAEVDDDGRILVRKPGDDCGVLLSKGDATEVLWVDDTGYPDSFYDPSSWLAIDVGFQLYVWVDGPMTKSCPGQATAGTVVIGMEGL